MINKVISVGNVGKDPEVRYVSEGVPTAKFSLATSESYKNKQGERVTNTEWHSITAWRGLAKVVEDYVVKGMPLYIEGKIRYRSYEKDGVTKYFTEIVASELKMLGKQNSSSEPAKSEEMPPPIVDGDGDDLPF